MTAPSVSVIVVSQGRPEELSLALTGIGQLLYDPFEIIVVADAAGRQAVEAMGRADRVKLIAFDIANISAARNMGLRAASGEVVAFIDDDAVPEPLWLAHLTQPIARGEADAAGGFVRGRNGISFQWQAEEIAADGTSRAITLPGTEPLIRGSEAGRVLKTQGCNMAFRRERLAAIGGFDETYRFFLDDTDLNLRLGAEGVRTAIVPLAQVHHGFAASARRRADRVPTDLFEIGASQAAFLRRHSPSDLDLRKKVFFDEQWMRLERHLISGGLSPSTFRQIWRTLSAGWDDGLGRSVNQPSPIISSPLPFLRYERKGTTGRSTVLAGRSRWRLENRARTAVERGDIVSVFAFSPTTLYHQVKFTSGGYWLQTGGVFGRSDRSSPLFQAITFGKRVKDEVSRVAAVRGLAEEGPIGDETQIG